VRVALLPTCLIDTVAPEVGMAAVRVLRRQGHEVTVPRAATCCGQPAWNAGFAAESAKVARQTLDALNAAAADADVVCVPAGSCAAMMKVFWPELFHVVGDDDAVRRSQALAPRIKEFSELVEGQGAGGYPHRVAYHHSCHMLRELGLHDRPEQVLDGLGCERVAWSGDERCCGFGGLFSVKQPETSVAMADDKLDSLAAAAPAPDVLVGCDQSCLMHLEGRLRTRGSDLPVKHLAEVLDEAEAAR
jgi:L-lactate dehydrogenase complex protein LldE